MALECGGATWALGVDAGHGGADRGSRGEVLNEATLALELGTELATVVSLLYPDVVAVMLREDDTRDPPLRERNAKAIAAGCELIVSIHANAAPQGHVLRGGRVFFHPANDRTDRVAHAGAAALPRSLKVHRTGMPAFAAQYPDALALLNAYRADAVLFEVGFLDYPPDEAELAKEEVKAALVASMLVAIADYRIIRIGR